MNQLTPGFEFVFIFFSDLHISFSRDLPFSGWRLSLHAMVSGFFLEGLLFLDLLTIACSFSCSSKTNKINRMFLLFFFEIKEAVVVRRSLQISVREALIVVETT
ncbi:hypothetical protein O6H91_03G072300 [Diphasiastrum complanatum]|uniref:Uncharacterized protein n=1 Tax=Diphasiastrum complanatum TaxID=34168 RepID=A0ACC2E7G3_DIPCM|nr:hypothetical protein O6H91_03G072300 [Diphasiastrum complanatum]